MILEFKDDLDLKKTAQSGQCFRWEEVGPERYRIPHKDSCLIIEKLSETSYGLSCDEAEYERLWRGYLDADTDYRAIRKRIDRDTDPFLYAAAEDQKGIRILKQDKWETLISFIISQNRNIPAIKRSIELLCEKAGEKRTDPAGQSYYAFPTPQAVYEMRDDALKECRLGYRDEYIKRTARAVCEGELDPEELACIGEEEAFGKLMSLHGVGKKVASCVMLYGLHFINAFPIDVWVKRILQNEYPDGYPMEEYAPYNGIYQQYMFAYYRKLNEKQTEAVPLLGKI